MIRAVEEQCANQVAAAQVIPSLTVAVKELVENALDANATSIEIKFLSYGLGCIEVNDNGSGIGSDSFENLVKRHHTSKLASSLRVVDGDEEGSVALPCCHRKTVSSYGFRGQALSALSMLADLSILTAVDAPESNMGFQLKYSRSGDLIHQLSIARPKGTSIRVENIFNNLPVRFEEFKRHVKREFGKCIDLIYAYAIIQAGVRFLVTSDSVEGSKKQASSSSIMRTIGSPHVKHNISDIFGVKTIVSLIDLHVTLDVEYPMEVFGFISKPLKDFSRSSKDRQYLYINGRPFLSAPLSRGINQVYQTFLPSKFPFFVLDIRTADMGSSSRFDINVSPDKLTIFMEDEHSIVTALCQALVEILEPFRGVMELNTPSSGYKSLSAAGFTLKRPIESAINSQKPNLQSPSVKRAQIPFRSLFSAPTTATIFCKQSDVAIADMSWSNSSLENIVSMFKIRQKSFGLERASKNKWSVPGFSADSETDAVVHQLVAVIGKSDFLKMHVVGQFNKGFIISKLGNSLFLVDQHASDEKFTYEMLEQRVNLSCQPLLAPVPLYLSVAQDLLVRQHLAAFELVGFRFMQSQPIDQESVSNSFAKKWWLKCVPVHKDSVFDVSDFFEMLNFIQTHYVADRFRFSRLSRALASKACRTSVMIGTALPPDRMEKSIHGIARTDDRRFVFFAPRIDRGVIYPHPRRVLPRLR